MPIGDYRLFIFDWDGTLSTSTPIVRLSRLLKRRYNIDYIRSHVSEYDAKASRSIKEKEEVNRAYAWLYDLYARFVRPRLQIGAAELLAELRKRGKTTAIFSDSARYRLVREARMLGIAPRVDLMLSAESIGRYKPNPEGLLALARRFRVARKSTLYIGDMASDILTARFAGMDVCTVANGVDPYALLKELKPEYLFSDLTGITSALRRGRTGVAASATRSK